MGKADSSRLLSRWLPLAAAIILSLPLAGCSDWEPGYGPAPGYDFYDNALTGCWELLMINGRPVAQSETNYLEFYGNGRGSYSYYYNGIPRQERMSYWCEDSYNSVSAYEVNISYAGSRPMTMNYWFGPGGTYLYLDWDTNRGPVTYTYGYLRRLPYPFN